MKYWREQDAANIYHRGEKYGPFRQKLDKATNHMCSEYNGIQTRMESGAEIFKADIIDSDSVTMTVRKRCQILTVTNPV